MTRNNFSRKTISLIIPPVMVASIISAMSPMIGKTADQTSQPWERCKQQMQSNFSGFLAESQQSISTAINELSGMCDSDAKRSEAKANLIQERTAFNILSKASTREQFNTAYESLGSTGLKFAEFKKITLSFAKAHLAATAGTLYCTIKMNELRGYNKPDKEGLGMVKYMDQQHKVIQQSIPDYKFSKSHRFVAAIHNFYTCDTSTAKDTASKPRDTSKESAK